MATLHIINRSAFNSRVANQALLRLGSNDGVLFIEDGVYNCLPKSPVSNFFDQDTLNVNFYALNNDCAARGLHPIHTNIKQITYDEFVALTLTYHRTHSWY